MSWLTWELKGRRLSKVLKKFLTQLEDLEKLDQVSSVLISDKRRVGGS